MNSSSTLCLDASLVVALLGTATDPQIEYNVNVWIAQGARLVAPRLIGYEVTNALRQLVRQGRMDIVLARDAIGTFLALPIEIIDSQSFHLIALEYATHFDLPATYDAHYLALAEELDCEFWTADKRLARAVRHELDWVNLFEP